MELDLTASAKDIVWIAALAQKHAGVKEISDATATDASSRRQFLLPRYVVVFSVRVNRLLLT